jgi:photosystem II stability/assembly factor-like uncharacterized protein
MNYQAISLVNLVRGLAIALSVSTYLWANFYFCSNCPADDFWTMMDTGSKSSLRGLVLCDDAKTVWACGSAGTVLTSQDLGKSWKNVGPTGFDKLEFRSIAAWSAEEAIIASAGTPAIVLKTDNGGQTWREVLRRPEEKAFFDGLRFYDRQRGILFSDPVAGHWLILTTQDGGETWTEIPSASLPLLRNGETAFAASNSSLQIANGGSAWLATGGGNYPSTRIYYSVDYGRSWKESLCPLPSGEASGVFSVAQSTQRKLIAVGGDYRGDAKSAHSAAYSADLGKTWTLCSGEPKDFRSCVICWNAPNSKNDVWLTVGPSGTDRSIDGEHWESVSQIGFHVIAGHSTGTVIAVGSEGRCGVAQLK